MIEKVNGQLDKVKEFRHFAMFASFVFFLDSYLILLTGTSLSSPKHIVFSDVVQSSSALLFLTSFLFFTSFIVPLIRYVLLAISIAMPQSVLQFFQDNPWKDVDPKDCCRLSDIEAYALKNECSVTYEYYKSLVLEREKMGQLNYYCLALILAVTFNFYAFSFSSDALFSWLLPFLSDKQVSFPNIFVSLCLWSLVLFSIYMGIIRGGGFSYFSDDLVYFPDNKYRK